MDSGPSAIVWVFIALFALAGFLLIIRGIRLLWRAHIIHDMPSTPIGSLTQGFRKITGKAEAASTVTAPFSKEPCAYYRYRCTVQERGRDRASRSEIREGGSLQYFYVDDGTGKILVDPLRAEAYLMKWNKIPFNRNIVVRMITDRRIYHESRLMPGDEVCIVGTVQFPANTPSYHRERFSMAMDALRLAWEKDLEETTPVIVKDRNMPDKQLEDTLKNEATTYSDTLTVGKGKSGGLIISDMPKNTLARNIVLRGIMMLLGGIVFLALALMPLLLNAGRSAGV